MKEGLENCCTYISEKERVCLWEGETERERMRGMK